MHFLQFENSFFICSTGFCFKLEGLSFFKTAWSGKSGKKEEYFFSRRELQSLIKFCSVFGWKITERKLNEPKFFPLV